MSKRNDASLQKITAAGGSYVEKTKGQVKTKKHDLQYRVLFDKSPLPMLIYELSSYRILDVNEMAVLHYGYSKAEFLNMTIHDYRPQKDVEEVNKILNGLIDKNRAYQFGVYEHLKKNNTTINVEVSGYAITYDDKECMMVVFNDITEKEISLKKIKDNEQKLLDSQQQLSLIYNNVKDVIFVISIEADGKFKFLSVNQAFTDITGIQESDVIGKYIDYIIPEPSLTLAVSKYKQAISSKEKITWTETTPYPTGTKIGEVTVTPIFDQYNNCVQLVGSVHDITELKKEERQLRLLESVITNTNDSVIIMEAEPFDEQGPRIIYVNNAFTKMTGYTAAEVLGKSPRILQGPNSDRAELARLNEAIRNWLSCEITIINYKKSGEQFWINTSITPIANEKGTFTHWIAIERDVTEQKLAEQKLNSSYKERNEILESIGDGFFAMDKNWVVNYWNKRAEVILEKPREEVIGRDLRDIYPDIPGRATYEHYKKAFKEKTVQSFETLSPAVNRWFDVMVYPSENGLSVYFKDITERLLHSKAIEQQNEKLRTVAWMQSHLTRPHVANLLGLMNVLKNEELTEAEKGEVLNHLLTAVSKLDAIILEIVENAEEIKYK
ncbi:PAS domain S-box protein [Mucilaginibacter rubeus]|uniref:PAS domain S-box protein n=1 Tax=Mucilaginibacter rubeus TaxID=2027860 RepID=A0AAE6JBV0_9SPHI|nr:PAS domain S-box protein [Mucilaginibacter rubeus]QEM02683.1 PAS domain S-box protein [Mucilaginibacter rubeus]QTE41969.1 PAS domain S-box protein [Mucilaginibacter rubeus]QTE48570.1 PAS domain S-box protein [Mucilaginibacter rubeus]QTE59957.1 PAS domain S-box protein [Mucilaginibacter rubeus]QTE60577.1 PAS domain S-box protein [Mucilaginibacter rubeus]